MKTGDLLKHLNGNAAEEICRATKFPPRFSVLCFVCSNQQNIKVKIMQGAHLSIDQVSQFIESC